MSLEKRFKILPTRIGQDITHLRKTPIQYTKQCQTLFWGAPKSVQMVTAAMKLKLSCLLLGKKAMTNLDSILKNRDTTLPTKV